MFSREDRNDAAELITAYLSGRLDESHARIWNRIHDSRDATVQSACRILEEYQEGYEADVNLMEKSEWDYLERIRLVLLSEAELHRNKACTFHICNLVACIGITGFAVLWLTCGWHWTLLVGTSVLSILTVLLNNLISRDRTNISPYKSIIAPFASVEQLTAVYKSSQMFRKNKFPKEWRADPARTLADTFGWILCCTLIAGLLFVGSPLILLALALPLCEPEYSVILR